jgi:Protein of unknown function (DUF2911)
VSGQIGKDLVTVDALLQLDSMRSLLLLALIAPALAAAQDNSGQPILSPRDTTRATIGSAHLLVDYGRPSKRGRQVVGKLIPYDDWWRTGANAATTFVTDKDLVFGSTTVPAGTYTLYSLLQKSGAWLLIVNKQTKQWGTEYHQDQDLARIPMTTTSVSPFVEKFVINVVPQGSGGAIQLVWDTIEGTAAFTVK